MFGFFFRDTQHSSKIGLVRVCFHCIELHFLTCFFTLESIYSFFIFHVEYRHRSIFVFDTSFFHISVSVQFDQFPFQVFGTFDLIYSDHVTVVFTDTFDLFVDHFIVNFDGIERYFFTFAHFEHNQFIICGRFIGCFLLQFYIPLVRAEYRSKVRIWIT